QNLVPTNLLTCCRPGSDANEQVRGNPRHRCLEEVAGGLVRGDRLSHLTAELIVISAGLRKKRGPLSRRPRQSALQQVIDLLPAFPIHDYAFIARWSQAFAVLQSRLTVIGDTPSTAAVSSTPMPPKKRNSTT